VCARSFFIQSWWNFEGMQNLGFLFGLDPWLHRIYPDPEEYRRAALRHLEFFNTQPYMVSFALGLVGAMEEQRAAAPEAARPAIEERIRQLKRVAGSSLAAIGDSFFWGALKPACAAMTILTWLVLWTAGVSHPLAWGALAYLVAYNVPAVWIRWKGLRMGYYFGEQLPAELKKLRWQSKTRWTRRVGLCAASALALACLIVPPFGGTPGLKGAAALAAALGLRSLGVSTMRLYAGAAALGLLLALVRP